jgi:hypothetical protein
LGQTWRFRIDAVPHTCWARMQGQYPGNRGGRPCGDRGFDHTDARSARLFLCAGCRMQVLICSCCDRGQIYCAEGCAQRVRRRSQQCAGQRYQNSPAGRRRHAARQGRYRARDKKVTHHGSPPPRPDDLLAPGSPMSASDAAVPEDRPRRTITHCHWCGRRCPQLVRQGFLRRRGRRRDRL